MNLGPVKHEESFWANIFLLRVHSLLLDLNSIRAGLILFAHSSLSSPVPRKASSKCC